MNKGLEVFKIFSKNSILILSSSILNFIAPLATIPLVLNFFSISLYSKTIFNFSLINLVLFFFNFGYNSGAIQILKRQKSQKSKKSIFIELLKIKFILILVSFLALIIFSNFQNDSKDYFLICCIWLLLNELFNQLWIFQSFNSFKYFLFINILNKLLTIVFLSSLFFFNNRNDIIFPLILAAPYLITSFFAIIFILKITKGDFFGSWTISKSTVKSLFLIHIGNLSSFSYQQLTRVFVGIYLPSDKLIIFDLSDKLFNVLKAPLGAISNSEGIRKISTRSKVEILNYWTKLFRLQLLLISLLALVIFISSKFSLFYKGISLSEIFYCLAGLSISLPFVAMSNTFGVLFTPIFGGIKVFNLNILIGGGIFIIGSFLLLHFEIFSLSTLIITLFFVEVYIGISCFFNSKKHL